MKPRNFPNRIKARRRAALGRMMSTFLEDPKVRPERKKGELRSPEEKEAELGRLKERVA